jgi:hypothetical protein
LLALLTTTKRRGGADLLRYTVPGVQPGDAPLQLVENDRGAVMPVPAAGGGADEQHCGNACAYLATAHAAGLTGRFDPHALHEAVIGILRTDARFRRIATTDNLAEWADALGLRRTFSDYDEYVNFIAQGGPRRAPRSVRAPSSPHPCVGGHRRTTHPHRLYV